MSCTWSVEPRTLSGPVTLAGDAGDRHLVIPDVLAGLELVEDLVDGVLARAVDRIVLRHQSLAEVTLLPAHRDRARVHHAFDAAQACRLEAVVHSEDVEAEDSMRVPLPGADAVGEVDEPIRLHLDDGPHDVLELRDVTTDHRHPVGCVGEPRRAGVEIHADDGVAAGDQPSDESGTDEPRAADHQYRHPKPPRARTRTRSTRRSCPTGSCVCSLPKSATGGTIRPRGETSSPREGSPWRRRCDRHRSRR